MKKFCVAVLLSLVASLAFAQASPSLEQLKKEGELNSKIEQNQKAIDAADNLMKIVETMGRARNLACMKAFGQPKFCTCLSDNLPVIFNFTHYVAITTQTKEENSYSTMHVNDRKAYDMVGPIRDKCVASMNQRPAGK